MEHISNYMEEALRLSLYGLGNTSPNPSVGSVIVKNGKIVGRGFTQPSGYDHAEVMAIKEAAENADGAEMYVSLEPCCHYGKTPPCTKAIIEAKIRRVHIPLLDPNPKVSGKGVVALKDAGIEVVFHHEYADAASDIIRPFKKLILQNRPFVILKLALSLDGYIATPSGDSKWITNEYSRYIVHRLRTLCDGVMVGKNTIIKDNPFLTVRFSDFADEVRKAFGENTFEMLGKKNFLLGALLADDEIFLGKKNPLRIIFGLPKIIEQHANVFKDTNYLIFENIRLKEQILNNKFYQKDYENGRLHFLPDVPYEERVREALNFLAKQGHMMIMIEGGAKLAGSFLDSNEIDQCIFFIAPKILGRGKASIEAEKIFGIYEALMLKDISAVFLNGDVMVWGYSYEYHFERV